MVYAFEDCKIMENKKTIELLFVLLILSYTFLFQGDIINFYEKISNKAESCSVPITYSIGKFDTNFNISEEEFKSAIKEAEDIWEKASGRNLFEYSAEGEMKVSLIYDYRQESTSEISYLDSNLSQDNNYYSKLKSQYELLVSEHNQANQELNSLISSYNQRSLVYQKEVNAWNRKKGTQEKYDQLNEEKTELESLSLVIKNKQGETNDMVLSINQMAERLNVLSSDLNLNIAKYNNVIQSSSQEFEQGNYITGPDSKEINIYQFENRDKLVRVLAHELGHALGIDHLNDSEDIMYAYNIGKNQNITKADLQELNTVCPQKH
jgi:predicted Zn-dependent protease